MATTHNESVRRRRLLALLGVSGAAALAGCLGDESGDEETPTPGDEPEDEETPTPADEETPEPDEDDAEDEDEPLGDLQLLVDVFDDRPVNDAQHEIEGERRSYTPRHVWKWVTDESFIGLHFDDPNPEEADALDYILVGRKGLFTEESRPGEEFSHFHRHTADSWEAGHGGSEGDEGYWLTHIAVREIQYPFHDEPIGPRVDYEFMPTPPPEGSEGHATDFESPDGDEGDIAAEDIAALVDAFDHRPVNDAQHEIEGEARDYTPRHVWFEANEDVVLLLHLDEPNPEEATAIDYFGMGVRGRFTVEDVPAGQEDDFTHFHLLEADGWEAGHGGQDTDDEGYWLVHHAVREIQYPFHDEPIDVGVDREFMPTPPPDQ